MNGKIFSRGTLIGELVNYDFYQTQKRVTFKTSESLIPNQTYSLKLDDGLEIQVLVTSAPNQGTPTVVVHAALLEIK